MVLQTTSREYGALAERLELEVDVAPSQGYGVRLVDAGSTSGGIDQVARVARLAHNLGLCVVAMIDYDRNEGQAAAQLTDNVESELLTVATA